MNHDRFPAPRRPADQKFQNQVHGSNTLRRFLILLLFALTAAKIGAILARGPVSIENDAYGYWRLSSLVLSGDPFLLGEPIAYRTPIYPWFVALIRKLSDAPLLTIVIVQGVLALASIAIAALIAGRATNQPRAVLLTWATALPAFSAFVFSAAVLSETLFIFLVMLNLLAVSNYAKQETIGRAICVGISFALALLTKPIVLLLWIPHLVFLIHSYVRKRKRFGRRVVRKTKLRHCLGHLGIAFVAVMLIVSPWLLRNQSLFGHPFITEFLGRNIWIVTFQDGSGAGLMMPDNQDAQELKRRLANVGASEDWQSTWKVSRALVASGLSDAQADRLMKRVAFSADAADLSKSNYKRVRRIANFWRCAATDIPIQGGAGNYRGQQIWKINVPFIDWVIEHRWSQSVWLNTLLALVTGLATLYLMIEATTRPFGIWIALIFGYFTVVTGVLEIPDYRYRIVVEPIAAMTIGSAIAMMFAKRRSETRLPKTTTRQAKPVAIL